MEEAEGVDGQGPPAQLQGAKRAQVVTTNPPDDAAPSPMMSALNTDRRSRWRSSRRRSQTQQ
jgi:hypothetical protein